MVRIGCVCGVRVIIRVARLRTLYESGDIISSVLS